MTQVYLGEHHEIQGALDEYGYPVRNLRDLYEIENVFEEAGGVAKGRKIGERLRGKEYVGYYAVASNSVSASASGGLFIGGTGVQGGGASSAGLQSGLLNVTEFDCELERYIVYAEEKKEPVCAPPPRVVNKPKPRAVVPKKEICK